MPLSRLYMEGEGGEIAPSSPSAQSSSRGNLDLNSSPNSDRSETMDEKESRGDLDLNKSPVELEAELEVKRQLLESINVKKKMLRDWLDNLFRSEIRKQTGQMPPADFEIDNLDGQLEAMLEMSQTPSTGNTLALQHRHLSTLVTKLTRDDTTKDKAPAAVKCRLEKAVENAVFKSLQDKDFDPTDW